jgi:hypothetical protein
MQKIVGSSPGAKVSVPSLNAVDRRFKSGVKVSVPSLNAVDRRFKSPVKLKTIILVFAVSPLSTQN